MKIEQIKTEFEQYIVIKDRWILDVVLGTLIGNAFIHRDPLWTMITAPSSGGKSTVIAPCVGISSVFFVDDLTEKTLLSGYKTKDFKTGKMVETSLLKVIGNGVMAFSDFTSILAKNANSRAEILTQFKLVFDRKITKYTGTGSSKWEGKIGFLGAATPDIYYQLEYARSMGERFTYYWMEQPTDAEIAEKQSKVHISSKDITDIMAPMFAAYCFGVRDWIDKNGLPELKMTDEQRAKVKEASMFCVKGKATVHTNFKTGKVDQIPNQAGVGRDNKVFDTWLQTLQLMDCYERDDPNYPLQDDRIELIRKFSYSSINRERRKVLEILAEADGELSASEIGTKNGLGLEKDSVEMYLAPLHAVGLIQKKAGHTHKWTIDDPKVKTFIMEVSDGIEDTIPTDKDSEEDKIIEDEPDGNDLSELDRLFPDHPDDEVEQSLGLEEDNF